MSSDPEDQIQRENGGERKDPETRKRVDEIAQANEAWRKNIEDRLRTAIRWTYVGVGISLLVAFFAVVQWRQTTSTSNDNSKALCAWRSSLQDQVKRGKKLLKDHPEGLPGIATAEEIASDTANRQRVVTNFRYLDCA